MNIQRQEDENTRARVLILGIGNDFRGDDGFGLAVANRLQLPPYRKGLGDAKIALGRGDASELLDYFDHTDCLIMIDAIYDPTQPTGRCCQLDMKQATSTPAQLRSSSHLVSITEAIELGRLYDRLPKHLYLVGVTADKFEPGAPLSAPIEAAISPTCDTISTLVKTLTASKEVFKECTNFHF
jgi:hydrogenase maturation protease